MMIRERRELMWPFLGVLVCLFVLSATSPRSWERAIKFRRPGALDVGQLAAETDWPHGPSPTPLTAAGADLVIELSRDVDDVLARVGELEMVEPSPKLASRPLDYHLPPSQPPREVIPVASAEPLPEDTPPPEPVGPSLVASLAADEGPAPDDPFLTVNLLPDLDRLLSRMPDEESEDPTDGIWARPQVLYEHLDGLMWDCETAPWARNVRRLVRKLGPAISEGSNEAIAIVQGLQRLDVEADDLVAWLDEHPLSTKVVRAQHALRRRSAVWKQVALAGGLKTQAGSLPELEPGRLADCLTRIDAVTLNAADGQSWRDYLAVDWLEETLGQTDPDAQHRVRSLARAILQQVNRTEMNLQQQTVLMSEPFAELLSALRLWAAEPVDLAELLRRMERYEQFGLPADARLVAEDCWRLGISGRSDLQLLGRVLETHYRNANLRIAITDELLNRLVPPREPERKPVHDRILGRPVEGTSVMSSDMAFRLVPDANRLRLALNVDGRILAKTSSTAGPVTFYNDSQSAYKANKEMELSKSGLRSWPATVAVGNNTRLRGLDSNMDFIPLIGALVRGVALSKHDEKRPEMIREIKWKIGHRAKSQIDEEADDQIGQLADELNRHFIEPMADLSLGPTVIGSLTTDDRMTMRLRLAADEQLGGHTPRPQALSNSLLSCQIHESALNNLVQRLELDGGTFTVAELRSRLAATFNRPEPEPIDTENDDVLISLAPENAAVVQCRDGRIGMTLTIARLVKRPHVWSDFQIRVFYRPEDNCPSVHLVRDGVVQLLGPRLTTRSQIALRGVFSKVFSKTRPWEVLPERVTDDPRLAGLGITQFDVTDGWIGVSLGPRRAEPKPIVVQRPAVQR